MKKNSFDEVFDRLDAIEKRLTAIEKGHKSNDLIQTSKSLPERKGSLREFLIAKKPGDDVKKTLAVGYYLEKFEGLNSFSVKDLEAAFESGREKQPSNINDKVNMNIKNGHMAKAREKKENHKAWYLTNAGIGFLENSFK
jgi:hypothetical protein